jgi:hypothetical protein
VHKFLTSNEVYFIHDMLPETNVQSTRSLKDLAVAQVEDVDVVGFGGVLFLSSMTRLFECGVVTTTLDDADRMPVIGPLCVDDHDQLRA